MTNFMMVIRQFYGTRCIIDSNSIIKVCKCGISNTHVFNHLIQETNRQKLEARIAALEQVVMQLNEKNKSIENQHANKDLDYKHVN